MRVILQFLPLLIPIGVYLAYAYIVRRQTEANGGIAPAWTENTPVIALIWAGLICMAAGLIFWRVIDVQPTDMIYVPSRYVDGEIIPGTFIPIDQADPAR